MQIEKLVVGLCEVMLIDKIRMNNVCESFDFMLVKIADYPQLKFICWNFKDDACMDDSLILSLYERNWRYIEQDKLEPKERQFIDRLVMEYGNGVLNV